MARCRPGSMPNSSPAPNVSESKGTFSSVAADPIRAAYDEQRSNPRSSSAKLRWAVRALH
jgi:16S rRNA C1402 N4-methylase RsmH